jgi:hypothetical protein
MITNINGVDLLFGASPAGSVNVTGATVTKLDSLVINPYEINTGDVIIVKFVADHTITSGAPIFNYYLYTNTTDTTLVGATLLGTYTTTAGSAGCGVLRHIVAEDNKFIVINPSVSINNDYGDFAGTNISTITSLNFSSTYYFLLAANLTLGKGDVGSTTSYEFSITK